MEENKDIVNKIVIVYTKRTLLWSTINLTLVFVIGIFLIIAYIAHFINFSYFFIAGLFFAGVSLPFLLDGINKLKHPVVAEIDEKGVFWGEANKLYPWDEIKNLECQHKELSVGRFGNRRFLNKFVIIHNNGVKLDADITETNYSAYSLAQEIQTRFPNVNFNYI